MATNRDLLKEAIADAKAVKETAIANAKAALEEAFTPYLKEKLAAKINEMDEAEEEEVKEEMYDETEKMDEMEKSEEMDEMDEVSLDELLAELAEETEDENMMEEETEEEGLYEAKEEEEAEEEEMSIEDMSEDDLKSFIEDVIKDMVSAGELEAGHEGMENEEGAEEGEEEMEAEEGEEEELDEEINLDELLAEEEMEEEAEEVEEGVFGFGKGSEKDFLKTVEKATNKNLANKKKAEYDEFKKKAEAGDEIAKKIIAGINKHVNSNDDLFYMIYPKTGEVKGTKSYSVGASGPQGMAEISSELEEAMNTIKALQNELNEINLLNAKLLYTNKIFRNKSLTESQKIKVLTAFDKATSKKEVELVYETLQEGLKVSTTKAPIKESLGSASKVLGNASAKPIIEVDNQFARWQQLAGIKK